MGSSLRQVVPLLAIALGVIGLTPAVAGACSTLAPAPNLDWGAPLDGATDVPIDVVLLYELPAVHQGVAGAVPGTFALRDAAGREVNVTLRLTHVRFFELVPLDWLAPNTVYTLQASWDGATDAVQFTTGKGPLATPPPEIEGAVLEHWIAEAHGSSCDPAPSGTCVRHAPDDMIVQHAFVGEFGQLNDAQFAVGSFWTNLSGVEQGHPFECIQLRARAPNGTFGPPTVLCGDDYPAGFTDTPHGLECTAMGLTQNGKHLDTEPPWGCSTGPVRGAAPAAPSLVVAALLLLLGYRLKF